MPHPPCLEMYKIAVQNRIEGIIRLIWRNNIPINFEHLGGVYLKRRPKEGEVNSKHYGNLVRTKKSKIAWGVKLPPQAKSHYLEVLMNDIE